MQFKDGAEKKWIYGAHRELFADNLRLGSCPIKTHPPKNYVSL